MFKSMFENPLCPTPSPGGTHEGISGGADLPDGRKETPSSELGTTPYTTNIKDGQGPGAVGDVLGQIGKHDAGGNIQRG